MPITANQIVYYSRSCCALRSCLQKKDKSSSSMRAQCENFSIKQTTKMLFTQRLDSEKDISVFPLLKQIVLFSLMQNMKEIISQSKHHYR